MVIRRAALGALALALFAVASCDAVLKIPDRGLGNHLSCENGTCSCAAGFGDCDGDPTNGCEAPLSAAPNCGACGLTCANGTCSGGACACSSGFADCDMDPKNGCEVVLATDGHHCGACGHDCEGGDCATALCQPYVLGSVTSSYSLGIQGSLLYIGNCPGDASIVSLSVTGGAVVPVSDPSITDCGVIQAIGGGSIFWTMNGKGTSPTLVYASTLAAPLTTSTALTVAPPDFVAFLGATTGDLYVTYATTTTKEIRRTMLGVPLMAPKAVSSTSVATSAVAGGTAYWSDKTGLWSIGDADATATMIAPVVASAIAVDGTAVYAQVTDGIEAVPLAGGAPVMLAPMASTFALASDGTNLYYFEFNDETLIQVPLAGGAPRTLADSVTAPSEQSLATDAHAVYWIANDSVYKMVK